jgi:perosamine synthetase
MGRFGAFSFHGTKTITTGEGGMFVTNELDLYEQVLTLSNHGRARGQSKQFWPEMVGYKYKLSNIQAAIGCAQMQRIEILTRGKRGVFSMYQNHLKDLPLRMNPEPEGCTNGYWMPTFVVNDGISFDRDSLIEGLKAKGVDARVFFWPLSSTPAGGRKASDKPYVAESIHLRALNLPSHHSLSNEEVMFISGVVSEHLIP